MYPDDVLSEDRTRVYLLVGIVVFFCALLVYSAFFYTLPTELK